MMPCRSHHPAHQTTEKSHNNEKMAVSRKQQECTRSKRKTLGEKDEKQPTIQKRGGEDMLKMAQDTSQKQAKSKSNDMATFHG